MAKPLFKTTIVIWSEYDPCECELSDFARDAESGGSYCSKMDRALVSDPESDPEWDGTEFFDEPTPLTDDQISELADDHEESRCNDNGEAEFGREG